ncbi:MAG: carbohydrate kinase [Oscillospiraceae bacterium]|nr:carbohydrate kinase [Oscillospiraceae bacterium]
MKYTLGLDNGGSAVKAAIFDLCGKEIASSTRSQEMLYPQMGFTERNATDTWKLNCEVIKDALQKSGINAEQIIGVAATGYGNGIHMIDKDGEDVYQHVVSTDSRGQKYVEKFHKDGTFDKVNAKTMQSIWAAQPPVMLSWFRDNMPDVLEKVAAILSITDYIRFKLTGETGSELTNLSGQSQMDLRARKTDPEIYQFFGLEGYFDLIPPLCRSEELCGKVTARAAAETGLKEGTPVAGGFFDVTANCLASGIVDDTRLAIIAGTWIINEYLSTAPVDDRTLFMNSISYMPEYYLITEASPTCAGNFNWFSQVFLKELRERMPAGEFYDYCNKSVAAIAPDESNVVFLPYVYGSNARTAAQGTFFNLNSFHTREHVLRAVYEGMAFSSAYHVEKLREHKSDFVAARLSGGLSKSDTWAQMLSDVLQIPMEIVEGAELGAKGAAMAAAVAGGEFANFAEAAEAMVTISKVIEPNEAYKDIYTEKFARYKKAMELASVFAE